METDSANQIHVLSVVCEFMFDEMAKIGYVARLYMIHLVFHDTLHRIIHRSSRTIKQAIPMCLPDPTIRQNAGSSPTKITNAKLITKRW